MNTKLAGGIAKAVLHRAERHLFLCLGPECCPAPAGEATWEHVKRRLQETGLRVMRTKAACLRVCTAGPLLLVYPEGIWYREVTPERFDRILQEHLLDGVPVAEWVVATNPLGCGSASGAA